MNNYWYAIVKREALIIFNEGSMYFFRYYDTKKIFVKYKHHNSIPITREIVISPEYRYTITKEYESFADVLVDYPELIDV